MRLINSFHLHRSLIETQTRAFESGSVRASDLNASRSLRMPRRSVLVQSSAGCIAIELLGRQHRQPNLIGIEFKKLFGCLPLAGAMQYVRRH